MGGSTSEPPTVLLCALFSLTFESTYILPWIAHHASLGVDHFDMYMDDVSPSWLPEHATDHAELIAVLEASDIVTLFSMKTLRMISQERQLMHCTSNAMGRADWVGNWDIDEALVLGTPMMMDGEAAAADSRAAVQATTVASKRSERGAPAPSPPPGTTFSESKALKNLLGTIGDRVTGITIPRYDMGAASFQDLPGEYELQYTQFKQRFKLSNAGKSMWRPCEHTYPVPLAGHYLVLAYSPGNGFMFNGKPARGRPLGQIVTPDGLTIEPNSTSIGKHNGCKFTLPHLYHHVTRDCAVRLNKSIAYEAQAGFDALIKPCVERRVRRPNGFKSANTSLPLCVQHGLKWDRTQNQAVVVPVGYWQVADANLIHLASKYKADEHNNTANGTTFLPSFAVPMRLHHYHSRSDSECQWRIKVQKERGSIFHSTARTKLLNSKCRHEDIWSQNEAGKRTDHSVGNAQHVRLIHQTINRLFGMEGAKVTHNEKQRFRQTLAAFMKSGTYYAHSSLETKSNESTTIRIGESTNNT
jgi:hypothetical protein